MRVGILASLVLFITASVSIATGQLIGYPLGMLGGVWLGLVLGRRKRTVVVTA